MLKTFLCVCAQKSCCKKKQAMEGNQKEREKGCHFNFFFSAIFSSSFSGMLPSSPPQHQKRETRRSATICDTCPLSLPPPPKREPKKKTKEVGSSHKESPTTLKDHAAQKKMVKSPSFAAVRLFLALYFPLAHFLSAWWSSRSPVPALHSPENLVAGLGLTQCLQFSTGSIVM